MKITVKDLRERPVDLEFDWPPTVLDLEDSEFRFTGNVRGNVRYTLVGDRVLAKGSIDGQVEAKCVRCLRAVSLGLKAEVDVVYEQNPELLKDEFELGAPSDDVSAYFDGEAVDPAPELREVLMAELPSFPICSAECRGLCPKCGVDRNTESCDCPRDAGEVDNSWKAEIRKLKLDKPE